MYLIKLLGSLTYNNIIECVSIYIYYNTEKSETLIVMYYANRFHITVLG